MGKIFERQGVVIGSASSIPSWDVIPPGTVNGSDDSTEYSSYILLDPPTDSGVRRLSLPGSTLTADHGGDLRAYAQAWGPGIYHEGSSSPSDMIGLDGDYFLNTTTMAWWGPKADGSWDGTGPNALPSGTWILDSGNPADSVGENGNYYYNREDTSAPEWWGPKSGGTWVGTGPTALTVPGDVMIDRVLIASVAGQYYPKNMESHSVPGARASVRGNGSDDRGWVDFTPIPAGRGHIAGMYQGMAYYITAPIDSSRVIVQGTATGKFQLGDADRNVLHEFDLGSQYRYWNPSSHGGGGERSCSGSLTFNHQPLSWSVPITCCKTLITASGVTPDDADSSVTVNAFRIVRLY